MDDESMIVLVHDLLDDGERNQKPAAVKSVAGDVDIRGVVVPVDVAARARVVPDAVGGGEVAGEPCLDHAGVTIAGATARILNGVTVSASTRYWTRRYSRPGS